MKIPVLAPFSGFSILHLVAFCLNAIFGSLMVKILNFNNNCSVLPHTKFT